MEEQHHRLEEARINLTKPFTSEAEASEQENYGGTRSKTTSRATLTYAAPSVMPQKLWSKLIEAITNQGRNSNLRIVLPY